MIIVTGGAGFIGSNLVERLAGEGHEIAVIDNLHTGRIENLAEIGVKFFRKNSGEIAQTGIEKPEAVFHLGVYSSSYMYNEDNGLAQRAVGEFEQVLEYCRKNGSKLIFASTSSLYNGLPVPHSENAPVKATDLYTRTKLEMEMLAKKYSEQYGLEAIGLRYFSVYGKKERHKGKYANLVSQFLWGMQDGKPPLIYGDGSQRRDFIYAGDVAEANILAMKSGIKYGIYNVGTGKDYSLNELVGILNAKLGTEIKPEYSENKVKNYVVRTLADVSKARKELGFGAGTSIYEGIERIMQEENGL